MRKVGILAGEFALLVKEFRVCRFCLGFLDKRVGIEPVLLRLSHIRVRSEVGAEGIGFERKLR